ncbi:calcium-binding protein [Mesorhizobium sp.]|uniref:calcium-binding protein n=1 Tax=Mesorhizobium sp. TaxID=1871066 RepID=UPI000FE47DD7|nr:calcium-binding protein [Mesorhizobium sp.]RWP34141.1 MAG: calcium-binding protein [Mesorhizobium sp.]
MWTIKIMAGSYDNFLYALAFSESSNRYDYVNPQGYAGAYQAGESALRMIGYYKLDGTAAVDWNNGWTGKDGINSLADWLSSPAIQDKAAGEYFTYLWNTEFKDLGLQNYIGQTINGVEITASGLLAGAHLVGADSVAVYLNSGGTQGATDPWGTPVAEYIAKFGGYDVSPVIGTATPTGTGADQTAAPTTGTDADQTAAPTDTGADQTATPTGTGADHLLGSDRNDSYTVDNIGDVVDETGTRGVDTVNSSISYSLSDTAHALGAIEGLTLTGTANIDGTGNALANTLTGNAGNNHLSGLGGKDTIGGGNGNDTIAGGLGSDLLTGGTGADTFVFNSMTDSKLAAKSRDVIQDFSTAQGDKVDVSAIDANSVTAGSQEFSFIGTSGFTDHAGELRYATVKGNAVVYGDVDGNGTADFSMQLLHVASLHASDFIV